MPGLGERVGRARHGEREQCLVHEDIVGIPWERLRHRGGCRG
jgi:hypothetical protein